MKTILFLFLICPSFIATTVEPSTIYSFKVLDIEQQRQINFASFKGKKILIVNTGCKSPYRFQLEEMQHLYSAYKEKLVVIAFPSGDDFTDQEFNTNREIREFCRDTYGLTFHITEKTSAIGELQHPVFKYLIEEAKKINMVEPIITWTYTKFLLDEKGELLKVFPPETHPLSVDVTSYLNNNAKKWY